MQPDGQNPGVVWRVARKEMTLFFSSPVAYLFIGAFALVSLFVFFWAEAFFARNIADVRPLFEWMPVLLIFLSAAITMRAWSDERRTGTLEHVLTQAVPLWQFVVGKFLGCWLLLLLAVLTTLPIALTVSLLGDLDWGPVWAGYLATLLLGATYLSVGLFVSSRTDNPVVALMITTVIGALMYLLGSEEFTSLVNNQTADTLRALATGSRFESITRGILDVRDLYYYLSLVAVFLALNTLMLEQQGWSKRNASKRHSNWKWVTGLLVANLLLANVWVSQIGWLRKDVTQGQIYSISEATQQYLNQLQEPLRLRGYFSAKTHPLLAPLVPQLRDLLKEYEIAGQG
ncbi:MAG: ABC transporter permease subunit, partial [Oceanobacter sp.]